MKKVHCSSLKYAKKKKTHIGKQKKFFFLLPTNISLFKNIYKKNKLQIHPEEEKEKLNKDDSICICVIITMNVLLIHNTRADIYLCILVFNKKNNNNNNNGIIPRVFFFLTYLHLIYIITTLSYL